MCEMFCATVHICVKCYLKFQMKFDAGLTEDRSGFPDKVSGRKIHDRLLALKQKYGTVQTEQVLLSVFYFHVCVKKGRYVRTKRGFVWFLL